MRFRGPIHSLLKSFLSRKYQRVVYTDTNTGYTISSEWITSNNRLGSNVKGRLWVQYYTFSRSLQCGNVCRWHYCDYGKIISGISERKNWKLPVPYSNLASICDKIIWLYVCSTKENNYCGQRGCCAIEILCLSGCKNMVRHDIMAKLILQSKNFRNFRNFRNRVLEGFTKWIAQTLINTQLLINYSVDLL